MNCQRYIKTQIHLRVRAEYEGRDHKNGVYLQGMMSPQQALKAFQTFGEVREIQQYFNGKRVPVWRRSEGWGPLEVKLKQEASS